MAKQIVAIGGAGLSVEPDGLLLEKYILGLAAAASPKICYHRYGKRRWTDGH